jgi:hypothetical protein
MFRTVAAALVAAFFVTAVPAAADDHDVTLTAAAADSEAAPAPRPLAADVDWSLPAVHIGGPVRRGGLLPALYVSLAGLNAFDAYSTSVGLSRGAREANPLMQSVAGNPAALWAVKGGATDASIFVAERLWKSNRRAQAIAVMVVTNGMMAVVAARNASVLR